MAGSGDPGQRPVRIASGPGRGARSGPFAQATPAQTVESFRVGACSIVFPGVHCVTKPATADAATE